MCSDERFLPIFEKEQVGIIDGGILIDGDRQNDVPAVLGIEGGVPAELERAGRLAQSQAGCNAKAQYFVAARVAGPLHDLIVEGPLEAAPLDQLTALELLNGRKGAEVVREVLETVDDFGLLHEFFHIFGVVDAGQHIGQFSGGRLVHSISLIKIVNK